MRLRIIIEPDPVPVRTAELEIFSSVMAPRAPKFRALLGSLIVHLVLLSVARAGSQYLDWYHQDDVDWSKFRVEPLRLHLGEPIYFNAKTLAEQPVEGNPGSPGHLAKTQPARPAIPDGLQLPSARATHKDAPVILQPDLLPNAPRPAAPLPALAFWARQAPEIPKPRPREVVIPGRAEAPSPAAQPAGPPILVVPNREAAIADVNVALPQKQSQASPALPVPNTATVPVRLRNAAAPLAASFEALSGQPVNIIALAAGRDNGRIVEIPRGFQNLPMSTGGDGGQAGESGRVSADQIRASGQSAAPAQNAAAAQGSAPRQGSGSARVPSATSTAAREAGAGPQPASAPVAAVNAPGVVRIQHPVNGIFDVVVMQSAAREDLPGRAAMLTGSPIYTVYLNVGEPKEWLMEYCAPGRDHRQASPYQINVDDAGSITPPYPISTIIPSGIRAWQAVKQIVLRGLLTAAGNLQIAEPANASNSSMNQLTALVRQWVFRPAMRNNKAIDVEFVLVIPPPA